MLQKYTRAERPRKKSKTKGGNHLEMSRTWARQETDMRIMEGLYFYKAISGVTIVNIYTPEKNQRGYDRLHALMKKGMVEGIPYQKAVNKNGTGRKRKLATLYYLTARGVAAFKEWRGIEIDGSERTQCPDDDQLPVLYIVSQLIENIPAELTSGRSFKIQNKIPNFVAIDLVFGNWQIIIEREQTDSYRRKLCHQIKGISANPACGQFMILCPTEAKRMASIKLWKEEYGPNVRFMVDDNYEGITRLLWEQSLKEIIHVIEQNKGPVKELPKPENGCTHLINNELCTIVDLIGFSPRNIRHLASGMAGNVYVGLESVSDLAMIAKRFPDIIKPGYEFFTLDGITVTSEAVSVMFKKR